MNILNRVTWQAMWKNRTRTIVTIIGVILSAAMFTAVTTLGYSLWSYLVDIQMHGSGDYYLRYDYTSDAHLEELRQDERVSAAADLKVLGFTTFSLGQEPGYVSEEDCIVAAGDRAFYDMVTVTLEEGRLPETSWEIVISRNIYYYLKEGGLPCEVGEAVTLSVTPENLGVCEIEIPEEGKPFTKTYTIVGIGEQFTRLNDFTLYLSHLLTYADGSEEAAVWHRVFVKTARPMDAHSMEAEAPEGTASSTNDGLLQLYGASRYTNYNTMIAAICAVLMAIIMVGSVSLIYNAFSISVSERTKQFGLLSSVGATRKQLRRSIRFEALVLSALGIPIGIGCGYGGIAVTLELLGSTVDMLFDTAQIGIVLRAVPSPLAFVTAGAVALMTVLLSAYLPAKRATKVPPLSAIRQTQDYQVPKRGVRSGGLTSKLFGLPGLMAKKYYAVSRRKYRTTIISLSISIVLFLSAFTLGQTFRIVAGDSANLHNFDMLLYYVSEEDVAQVRELEAVADSALWTSRGYVIELPEEDQSEDYRADCEMIAQHRDIPMGCKMLSISYLEDEVLLRYLQEQGIDPEPYFDEDCPTALVCKSKINEYVYDPEKDIQNKVTHISDVFAEGVEELALYPEDCPDAVLDYMQELVGDVYHSLALDGGVFYSFFYTTTEGNSMTVHEERVTVQVLRQELADGSARFSYHLYDEETGLREEEPIYTEVCTLPKFRLGACIQELPYGLRADSMSSEFTVKLILPLSAAEPEEESFDYLSLSVQDREAMLDYIETTGLTYSDYLASELQYRNLVLMIDVFSYGFIILISLICVANVFNTISTNIALRRRDFGMLRSVGMKTGELYRMMGCECLIYGSRALLWGLPVGIGCSMGIQWIFRGVYAGVFALPWAAIGIAAVCVFGIVFASMFYAVGKLKRDNPIEAIRMENI